MGRQTATDRTIGIGAGVQRTLDPGCLPVRFESHLAMEGARAGQANRCEVVLSNRDVTISTHNGPANGSVVVPIQSFAGVMVQITPGITPGCVTARLVLKHFDPALSVVLIETDQPEGLALSWPAWAESLNLPMLVCDTGGSVKPIEAFSAKPKSPPAPRRKMALLTGRRPRFLVRRRCGSKDRAQVVYRGERELISRT
ncbi:DUF6101 family protein [Roseibium limicola]|uniref:Uncharacterized protein n=1 Tax=Roseibium limicola TaxID=2816037 RepID=A0A939EQV8_9HYPH|nr:DUF6101 family protein [Roseibium limicola]MBO0345873.1 hypothetical protein [Roseibium limicola]